MKKIWRICVLHFEEILESRSRAFVWFLTSIVPVLILILFWNGATHGGKMRIGGWDYASLTTYYLATAIGFSLLISHTEESVAKVDIKTGLLSAYLLKPLSYYWRKFFEELPSRILQGGYGVIFSVIFFVLAGSKLFVFTNNIFVIFLSILIVIQAFILSFTMKIILGQAAFWLIETRGVFEAVYMIELIFSGLLLPIPLLPEFVAAIAYKLPFAYIIYFPIAAFEGKLTILEMFFVLCAQLFWIGMFYLMYQFIWNKGIRKFSGIGQ